MHFASPLVPAAALPGAEFGKRRKVLKDKTNKLRIMPAPKGCAAPMKSRGKGKPRTMASTVVAGQHLGANLDKLSDAAAPP